MKKVHLPITWPRTGSGSAVGNIRWLASQPETSQSPECHPAEKAIAARTLPGEADKSPQGLTASRRPQPPGRTPPPDAESRKRTPAAVDHAFPARNTRQQHIMLGRLFHIRRGIASPVENAARVVNKETSITLAFKPEQRPMIERA